MAETKADERSWRRTATGLIIGAGVVALVSAAVAVLKEFVDPQALTGLYLFAIFPMAIGWGFGLAGIVAVASYLTFAFFFAAPEYSLKIQDPATAVGLAISLVSAYVVSELARRAHARAREAQARAREAEQARQDLRRLADEQAALRRVATLVAQAVPTAKVFEAVTREVGLQCDADLARLERFEADGTVTGVASWSASGGADLAVDTRFELEGTSIAARVRDTGRPARVDSFQDATGPIAREARALGISSSVGCPVVVGGRTWGVIAASRRRSAPFPPNIESHIADFTELVATAISNAEARAELVASRARVVSAGDEARRRLVRDLHDGAQQRLVHTIVVLKLARRAHGRDAEETQRLLDEALEHAEQTNAELRELAHGILPAVLARSGLAAGVDALVSRMRLPVSVDVTDERFPAGVEAGAYFIVAEALTNVVKHSQARSAAVRAWTDDGVLRVDVRDDGVGGASPDGSGLLGLHDRVVAVGGQLRIESPRGDGTRIAATLPLTR